MLEFLPQRVYSLQGHHRPRAGGKEEQSVSFSDVELRLANDLFKIMKENWILWQSQEMNPGVWVPVLWNSCLGNSAATLLIISAGQEHALRTTKGFSRDRDICATLGSQKYRDLDGKVQLSCSSNSWCAPINCWRCWGSGPAGIKVFVGTCLFPAELALWLSIWIHHMKWSNSNDLLNSLSQEEIVFEWDPLGSLL